MKFIYLFWGLCFIAVLPVNAQDYKAPKFGNGILNLKGKDSTFSMKVGLQMQFQGMGEWKNENHEFRDAAYNFNIRRARLKFDGFVYSPKLTYKVVLGLSNRDISGASIYTSNAPRYILDAVMKWNFYENFELWFGQTKLPGNREHLISSANLQFVDRSILNSAYNLDRDLGIQLRHQFKISDDFIVKEAFAFSQGEGRNITTGNLGGFQYTSRLELLPFGNFSHKGDYVGGDLSREIKPKMAFGITYDFNDKAVKTRSNQGSYMVTDTGLHTSNITTVFVDAMFKYQGFSFMAEYANRKASNAIATNADGTVNGAEVQVGNGWNFQSGYLFSNNWEIAARYTNIGFDQELLSKMPEDQFGLAVSKYMVGHKLKVQTDINYLAIENTPDILMWRVQFQVHF